MSKSLERQLDLSNRAGFAKGKQGGRAKGGEGEATRYKFPDIRPFVSFEMGQFSRDLMVIAFLGGHIAFHPVQCVRPIYQSASLSSALLAGLSRIRVARCRGRGCSVDEKEG